MRHRQRWFHLLMCLFSILLPKQSALGANDHLVSVAAVSPVIGTVSVLSRCSQSIYWIVESAFTQPFPTCSQLHGRMALSPFIHFLESDTLGSRSPSPMYPQTHIYPYRSSTAFWGPAWRHRGSRPSLNLGLPHGLMQMITEPFLSPCLLDPYNAGVLINGMSK